MDIDSENERQTDKSLGCDCDDQIVPDTTSRATMAKMIIQAGLDKVQWAPPGTRAVCEEKLGGKRPRS